MQQRIIRLTHERDRSGQLGFGFRDVGGAVDFEFGVDEAKAERLYRAARCAVKGDDYGAEAEARQSISPVPTSFDGDRLAIFRCDLQALYAVIVLDDLDVTGRTDRPPN